jgi:ATP-dependent Clp protease protease subunit
MIHNPAMLIAGEVADLQVGINLLSEVKESIINAYQTRTGLSRAKISHMMDAETWMSAHKAIELKFADKILYESEPVDEGSGGFIFDQMTVTNALRNKLPGIQARMKYLSDKQGEEKVATPEAVPVNKEPKQEPVEKTLIPIAQLERRLELIKNWR